MEMNAPDSAPRRWYQSGWLAIAFVLVGLGGAIVLIRSKPTPSTTLNISLNPIVLDSIPTTDVQVRSYDDPYLGNDTASVVVVEFADFQCPFCRQVFPTVRELMNTYGDRVLFVYRDYPISEIHDDAQKAGEAGQCAWDQGSNQFWAFHDRLFLNQDDLTVPALKEQAAAAGLDSELFAACLDGAVNAAEVATDYADGLAAGVRGTPTFFINNRRYEGPLTKEIFEQILNAELNAVK